MAVNLLTSVKHRTQDCHKSCKFVDSKQNSCSCVFQTSLLEEHILGQYCCFLLVFTFHAVLQPVFHLSNCALHGLCYTQVAALPNQQMITAFCSTHGLLTQHLFGWNMWKLILKLPLPLLYPSLQYLVGLNFYHNSLLLYYVQTQLNRKNKCLQLKLAGVGNAWEKVITPRGYP